MTSTATENLNETSNRVLGQVKWFNNKAGYGFITVSDGEHSGKDIFVHYSSINLKEQYAYLVQGEYLELGIEKSTSDKYELQANNISGVKNGKLMCEVRRIARENNEKNGEGKKQPKFRRYNVQRDNVNKESGDGFVNVQSKKSRRSPNNKKQNNSQPPVTEAV